jgi:hypothetical protein
VFFLPTGVVAAVKNTYNLMSEVLDHSTNKNSRVVRWFSVAM